MAESVPGHDRCPSEGVGSRTEDGDDDDDDDDNLGHGLHEPESAVLLPAGWAVPTGHRSPSHPNRVKSPSFHSGDKLHSVIGIDSMRFPASNRRMLELANRDSSSGTVPVSALSDTSTVSMARCDDGAGPAAVVTDAWLKKSMGRLPLNRL